MVHYVLLYVLTIPIFVLFDLLWLGVIAKDFYQSRLGELLGPVVWPAAVVFYFVFVAGLLFFAVLPALEVHSLSKALVLGALFGLVTYATYDLTNHATLRDWPLMVTVVDILWGTVLGATVATLSYLLGNYLQ
ncbi:DUF2177 family protein [Candidatus Nomurabacteria bacterium]|nr:DUF2177 family protein [Candidatus Nomurabacteria bacterium]